MFVYNFLNQETVVFLYIKILTLSIKDNKLNLSKHNNKNKMTTIKSYFKDLKIITLNTLFLNLTLLPKSQATEYM